MAEEAAAVAQEFVSSLDNLSSEVAFLLNEIRIKDERCVELTTRLTSRTSSHLKHIRPSSTLSTPNPNVPTILNPATTKETTATLPKISSEFEKLAAMQAEKVALSERLMTLVGKHARKLELEVVGKVAELGGVPTPAMVPFQSAVMSGLIEKKGLINAGAGLVSSGNLEHKRRRTSQTPSKQPLQIQMPPPQMSYSMQPNSRHSPLSTSSYMPPQPTAHQLASSYTPYDAHHMILPNGSSSSGYPVHSNHSGQQQQQSSQQLQGFSAQFNGHSSSSSASRHSNPVAGYPSQIQQQLQQQMQHQLQQQQLQQQLQQQQASHVQSSGLSANGQPGANKASKRKRKSTQAQSDEDEYPSANASRPQVVVEDMGGEEDAVGEEEEEDGGDDDTLYCYCKQKSHGEMVGCDNEKCAIEWFHMRCVNLTSPLPESWFCPTCVAQGADRKRKGGRR
ncbi:inhibitor of growth protein amino-terminal histone-binding protein [Phaffia rhodozyma]|uniref:Chromatin modification-related protein n=1 Tax=Phaffia rhodozyma TaxID=264483 RepID=A0A0F7SHH3_PHARH|nr:inhibitor of growth protein amino-terminal histone-binding protein [Phaffia rhodozyma]